MTIPLSVHSLHALAYCERLFFLEEVERVRVADDRVYAGRTLHVAIERDEPDDDVLTLNLESEIYGLIGKVDCIRRRDGQIIPYEHKRGRSARDKDGKPEAWTSDRLQIIAYALLAEEHAGEPILEGRVRYHADNVTVRVAVDENARADFEAHLNRARELQGSIERPPVTPNERLCVKCSLAPVCLPEEARLAERLGNEEKSGSADLSNSESFGNHRSAIPNPKSEILRLFPAEDDRKILHVLTNGAKVGRKGDRLEIWSPETEEKDHYPVQDIGQIVLHGFAQISTQALRLCADRNVGVHWVTYGGRYMGAWTSGTNSVQRRIRQYQALTNPEFCLVLARRLAEAKIRGQLSFLLRASRESGREIADVKNSIGTIRKLLSPMSRAASVDKLRGYEGGIGAAYFKAMPHLIIDEVGAAMKPGGRNRRPPRDRCNALLSYGYALLLKDVTNAILTVGLDPSLGFYHTPRSQAHPLALDLMELFRVPLVDLPVVASINRRQWNEFEDFTVAGNQVWLSEAGRKKFIQIYERRKADQWKHPVIGYSLSYSRHLELEVRLLEKEWTENSSSAKTVKEPRGLFARTRFR
ncbi:MAG: type I-MYXAN CRISPR-associated endonuclease Cas1 [Acidobacteria bacterium]|nr:type I-MYXAN CRISPR-associated endonuclease Cas1 [Acidobacteriota bacterium]